MWMCFGFVELVPLQVVLAPLLVLKPVLGYPGLLYLKIERRSRESLVRDRGIAL